MYSGSMSWTIGAPGWCERGQERGVSGGDGTTTEVHVVEPKTPAVVDRHEE